MCGTLIYTQSLGPFSSSSIPLEIPIVVPITSNKITITGTAYKCDNTTPITNGSVRVITGVGSYIVPVSSTGQFIVNYYSCISSLKSMFEATDNATGITGVPKIIEFPTGTGTLTGVELYACPTSTTEFVSAFVKGRPYLWLAPTDDIASVYSVPAGYPNYVQVTAKDLPTLAVPTKYALRSGFGFTSTVGTNPLAVSKFNDYVTGKYFDVINTASPMVNITRVDAAGPTGFIQGNYSANVQLMPTNIPVNVYSRFSIRRP